MTIDEKEDVKMNLMSFNTTHMIDVPPDLTPIEKYRASLGHKVFLCLIIKVVSQVKYYFFAFELFRYYLIKKIKKEKLVT